MILVLGRRVYRLILIVLILLLILPLIQYYVLRTLEPETVHFREPRGDALKVSADAEAQDRYLGVLSRYLFNVHEFYQNGL